MDCKVLEDDLPLVKVFLIPAKEEGICYMVGKIFHTVGDGLTVLQLFSLMQDGGPAIAQGSNKVHYPRVVEFSLFDKISSVAKINEIYVPHTNDTLLVKEQISGAPIREVKWRGPISLNGMK